MIKDCRNCAYWHDELYGGMTKRCSSQWRDGDCYVPRGMIIIEEEVCQEKLRH